MNCVRPPLLKKPSRGFGWSCAACSRAQERKLEARNTPTIPEGGLEAEEEEFLDDEEDDVLDTCRNTPIEENHPPATAEQIYQCSLWPYRYLGIHCKVEDALDYDDRIFPRASTRLGPRHQANVVPWYGRPVVYEKPVEFKKVGRKNDKANKEIMAAMEAERLRKEKRPKWIQDTPPGYVERGGDYDEDDPRCTSKLLWKPPKDMGVDIPDKAIDEYMHKAQSMATSLGLPPRSTNLQDVARDLLFRHKFDTKVALEELPKVDKAEFKEPELTPAELKRFEEGVAKYGSELHLVMKHVKTAKPATVTRYYYTWKKTERGRQIWGNYSNRKGKKDLKKVQDAAKKLADDVADDIDDSAFDESKAAKMKKGFICKFCSTKNSRQWRRAPTHVAMVSESGGRKQDKDKNNQYIQALCRRCAELWRRYAIQWEDIDEVAKKVAQTGGKGWRKKVDEELYKELIAGDEMMKNTRYSTPPLASTTASSSAAASINGHHPQEPPRKKQKSSATAPLAMGAADRTNRDSDGASDSSMVSTVQAKKKDKAVEKPAAPTPPPVPVIPKAKVLPCAVCLQMEPLGDQHVSCKECRMSVHRNCYGVVDQRAPGKWTCDMCLNDKNPQVAIQYKCVLCPVEYTEHDFVELPRVSHKKKTEKEKEREKTEREAAFKAAEYYRKRQENMGRPVNPREPLKRTADNNWVHVTCAVFTPEVKFGMAKALSPAENIPSIPRSRYTEVCKACKKTGGACVSCQQCKAAVHVECAHQAGYLLGFDITPVKGSRRDQHNIVTIGGEVGVMSAGIWCKEHVPTKSSSVHRMHELVDESGLNVLQLYVQNFKQADLTLSGCARKANQISLAGKAFAPVPQSNLNRRASTATIVHGDSTENVAPARQGGEKICLTCGVEVSPKWYPINQEQERGLINGYYGSLGSEAQKFVEQRSFQCHKCKKTNRQPKPHLVKEPTPKPEPMQIDTAPAVISPPPPVLEPDHGRQHGGTYSWSPTQQVAVLVPPGVVAPPSQLQAPAIASMVAPMINSVHGPPMGPHSLPQNGPPRSGPSMPPQPYHSAPALPHQGHPYGDWQRHPQHGQLPYGPPQAYSHRDINGGPPPPLQQNGPLPQAAPLNHLRPPSMSSTGYPPPPPPVHHAPHMAQPPPPWLNGYPPSPRRMSAGPPPPPPPNGGPYPPVYHGMTQAPDYRNGAGPAQMPVHREPHPMYSAHGSPSAPQVPLPREQSHPPPPPRENRQASGASASPSVANLLS
ncbi:putative PHD type zinc finger protein with BAH domain-containing protein [Coniochaeta pulveracea]|uniref:Putative PHD type zinc finger protein with BAH domain-containing protein n=1 Tax=Coniochaeta pulveracea TaxID=177199 RepID=A0A420XY21_9PEZI|nr:putative PHD type zinc finger protein with BAH domain-containing protein [Coniochaeta pulveracea]